MVRRESVVRVELAELSAELDLDILSRLGNLSKAFSHCPTQTVGPGLTQVQLVHMHRQIPTNVNLSSNETISVVFFMPFH